MKNFLPFEANSFENRPFLEGAWCAGKLYLVYIQLFSHIYLQTLMVFQEVINKISEPNEKKVKSGPLWDNNY